MGSKNAPLAAGKYTPISVSIIAILVVAVYAALFGNYRANLAIDTPFYLSYSYNYCVNGVSTDATFGISFPIGQGGTVAFGKLAAIVQCAALAPFNWSPVAANFLSVAGVVLSMAAIFAFLVGEGFAPHAVRLQAAHRPDPLHRAQRHTGSSRHRSASPVRRLAGRPVSVSPTHSTSAGGSGGMPGFRVFSRSRPATLRA
jgi:hypothetical protein